MSYQEAITYLYESQPAFHLVGAKAYKPGLENTQRLMQHLGHPEKQFPSVHIAGTNGKGSTSHLIASSLQAAGYRVGLFTSPHLVDFRERIRINGEMIPEDEVVRYIEEERAYLDAIRPSFFESTMALAFRYFAEQQVDVAVVEVGLGGRLDSTNILTPELSVITNIGLDHTEFLGTTLAAIASEKAGIIKPFVPVVIGEKQDETTPVFTAKAAEGASPICFASEQPRLPEAIAQACALKGAYQMKNMQTAYVALRQLRAFPCSDEQIALGFASVITATGLRGRWEILAERPLTLCDTGHNSHGIRTYVASLRELMVDRPDAHLRIIFGMVSDKDVDEVLSLLPRDAFYYWVAASTHRAIPADEMRQKGLMHGLIGDVYASVEEGLRVARLEAEDDDVLFIGGSNYVVGEGLIVDS